MSISAEEQLACVLVQYLEAEPNHKFGFCFYLQHGPGSFNHRPSYYGDSQNLIQGYSYQLMMAFMKSKLYTGRMKYINSEPGFTPARKKLVEQLLDALLKGKVTYHPEDNLWRVNGKTEHCKQP